MFSNSSFFSIGKPVGNDQTLIDLGVQPHGTVQLEMTSVDPATHPLRPVKPQQYNMADVITVRVQTGVESALFREMAFAP